MLLARDIVKNEKFPTFIRNDSIFQKIEKIRKIFPEIGLADYEEKSSFSNEEAKQAALKLIDSFFADTSARELSIRKCLENKNVGTRRRIFADWIIKLFIRFRENSKNWYISPSERGTFTLICPHDVYAQDGKVLFKLGMSLHKVISRLSSLLQENLFLPLSSIDKYPAFKEFSSLNIPSNECVLKFSSATPEGVWDISTMSMRGIISCQTWHTASNHIRVIGSMVDPFTAIIYLTNNAETPYGSKMMRRCIVRYVHFGTSTKPTLLLEKMYPAYDAGTAAVFINSLKKRFSGEVIDYQVTIRKGDIHSDYHSPLAPELNILHKKKRPYADSAIPFKISKIAFASDSSNIESAFVENLSKEINKVFVKLCKANNKIFEGKPRSKKTETVLLQMKAPGLKKSKTIPLSDRVSNGIACLLWKEFANSKYKMPAPTSISVICNNYLTKQKLGKQLSSYLEKQITSVLDSNKLYG